MRFSEKLRELVCYSKPIHYAIWAHLSLGIVLERPFRFFGHETLKHGISGDGLGYVLLYCISVRGISDLTKLRTLSSLRSDEWRSWHLRQFTQLERQIALCHVKCVWSRYQKGGGGGGGDNLYQRQLMDSAWCDGLAGDSALAVRQQRWAI